MFSKHQKKILFSNISVDLLMLHLKHKHFSIGLFETELVF